MKGLKALTKLQEIRLLVFSCFTVSVIPSTNPPKYSNYIMILIISFISSFKINKVNHFISLTARFVLIFLSNLFSAFEANLLTNPGKLSLAKGRAIFVSAFFCKLPNQERKDLPDWINLDIWGLSFISFDLLFAKTFLILVVILLLEVIHFAILHLHTCS